MSVQRSVLANRASLLLAMGGDWTRSLAPPATEDSASDPQTTPSDDDDTVAAGIRSLRNPHA